MNVYPGERRMKKKMKTKTQNEKIVETDRDIWYQTYEKTVIRVRKKQCNVSSRMNYLQFAFKGPKYVRNIVFLLIFWQSFWNITKAEWMFFLHWIFVESISDQFQPVKYVFSTFWVIWKKVMHTREAPDFLGLHKNMNCAFPLI